MFSKQTIIHWYSRIEYEIKRYLRNEQFIWSTVAFYTAIGLVAWSAGWKLGVAALLFGCWLKSELD